MTELLIIDRILISRNLLYKHMVLIWCLNHIAIMINHHPLGHLYSTTVIMEVHRPKVLISSLLLCLLTRGITQL